MKLPKRTQSQLINCPPPTGQAHPSAPSKEADFSQLMVSEIGMKPFTESLPQLPQAFARAFTGRIVAQSDECRVTRIVPIRNGIIAISGLLDKSIQQIV